MMPIYIELLEEEEDWPPGRSSSQKLSPEQWRERLRKANEEVRNVPEGKTRSEIINKYNDLWGEVKEHYRKLSKDKCWYCETDTHRILGDIDHYRPKASVAGTDHPGYWWLAFEWRNWRFACKYCNSRFTDPETGLVGGKGDHFPLLDGEKQRIKDECEYEDYEDLLREDPLLLDPTEPRDYTLLTFTRDGQARPSEENSDKESEGPVGYRRAEKSIELYHLNHSRLVRERRRIYVKVSKHVHDYERFQRKWETEGDRSAQALAKRAFKELALMIARRAEYSMAARAYLKEYRSKNPDWKWIDNLLTAS